MLVAHVAEVEAHAIAHRLEVVEIAAVVGEHGVGDHHLGALLDQADRERRADEAGAAGDQRALPAEAGGGGGSRAHGVADRSISARASSRACRAASARTGSSAPSRWPSRTS